MSQRGYYCKTENEFECKGFNISPDFARKSETDQTCVAITENCRQPDTEAEVTMNSYMCSATDHTCYSISSNAQRKSGGISVVCKDDCAHKYWCKEGSVCVDTRETDHKGKAKTSPIDTRCLVVGATECRVESTGIVSIDNSGASLSSAISDCQDEAVDSVLCKDMTQSGNMELVKSAKGTSDICTE